MLLAVDVGNTNITCAAFQGRGMVQQWRIATSGSRTAEEYGVLMSQAMALASMKLADITDVIVATLVPETLFNSRRFCPRYFGLSPLAIGADRADSAVKPT